jgi:soluble lytic murein transglycosylase-like protein
MQKQALIPLLAVFMSLSTAASADRAGLDTLIARHATENNVPESLVHRVVRRESNYNPQAVGRGGALGLMQIKHATARGMGYSGSASGLLDADTNLTYAVRYLAGAYRVAGGNHDRAVGYYAAGYYYAAKRLGMAHQLAQAQKARVGWATAEIEATGSVRPIQTSASEPGPSLADLR